MADFTGTRGDDTIVGSEDGDVFDLSQGGNDTVSGLGGDDIFKLGRTFRPKDRLDGGAGDHDTLVLDGDYTRPLSFRASTLVGFEVIQFEPGHSYALTVSDATNTLDPAVQRFLVDATALGLGSSLHFDAHAETAGGFHILGGSGPDVISAGRGPDLIKTGAGNDIVSLESGAPDIVKTGDGDDRIVMDPDVSGGEILQDQIDGGAGFDVLNVQGSHATLGAETVTGIERIIVSGDASLVLEDSLVAAGQTLEVTAQYQTAGALTVDGSAETDGTLQLTGWLGNDHLIGGAGADHLEGWSGADVLEGGAGADILDGGDGPDVLLGGPGDDVLTGGPDEDVLTGGPGSDRFVFHRNENAFRLPDHITDLSDEDSIDLSSFNAHRFGGGHLFLVPNFDGRPGEVMLSYDAGADATLLAIDLNGDELRDGQPILISGDHTDFTHFIF